jgi:hypothetical protein
MIMHIKKYHVLLSWLFLLKIHSTIYSHTNHHTLGIIVVPVADVISMPHSTTTKESIHQQYTRFSREPSLINTENPECPRSHQVVFNELVHIIDYNKTGEVLIEIPNAHVMSPSLTHNSEATCTTKPLRGWTLKRNIIPLDTLHTAFPGIKKFIPSFNPKKSITLTYPVYDTGSLMTFSIGTQLVVTEQDKHAYITRVFNPHKKTIAHVRISRKNALPLYPEILFNPHHKKYHHTPLTRRQQFINCLQTWAHMTQPIPYVWGGRSYINEEKSCSTRTGFDCSGLVLCAAQTSGIPYICKNTTAISATLEPLVYGEKIEAGDLIVFPGHVIIISDIKKNLCIEARSKKTGNGIVHEINIAKLFKNIHTINDLFHAYRIAQPLERLNNGTIIETIKSFKIVKLPTP